jgi:acyl phosphate:glycerol-3-phosphate acyltransferase
MIRLPILLLAAGNYFPGLPGPSDIDFVHCMTLLFEILGGSYLLGSIPSGLLISLSRGIDIRKHGSGNIGATNVWRIMGKGWGTLAFLCDALKGWFAAVAGIWVLTHFPVVTHDTANPQIIRTVTRWLSPEYGGIAAAIGCILGHNFPVWLRFKGGKGVATSLGVIFGMMPLAALTIFAIWGIVFKVSRYVSLASITAAISLPVVVVVLMSWWPRHAWGAVNGWGNFYFAVAATFLLIKRHTPNIQRLMSGTEHRFGTPKTTEPAAPAAEPPPAAPPRP